MSESPFRMGQDKLSAATLFELARDPRRLWTISGEVRERITRFRAVVTKSTASGQTIYGVNTGFGLLADVRIDPGQLDQLQVNLIRSHACGVGEPVAPDLSRAFLLLKIHSLCQGYSAVSPDVVQALEAMANAGVGPLVPCKGSVGASGDLAPLAHLALGLIGEGEVFLGGARIPAAKAWERIGRRPAQLAAKDGLALINGTQFSTAISSFALVEAQRLARAADAIGALSLDGIRGTRVAFDERIQKVRPHRGQMIVAANLNMLLTDADQILTSHKNCEKVQDPYSFRCMPQVHGATRGVIDHVGGILDTELNSVTDNPLAFEDGSVLSGGNFHAQPVALALDYLGIACAELASISERRIEKLTNPAHSGLPAFVTRQSGLNSGFMIPHVVAAALVSENKILAHPASVDSIPTSADKEDHVSMAPIAARKCREIISNTAHVLSIELLTACQAIDMHAPLKPSPALTAVHGFVRSRSAHLTEDRSLHHDIEELAAWILGGGVEEVLMKTGVVLS